MICFPVKVWTIIPALWMGLWQENFLFDTAWDSISLRNTVETARYVSQQGNVLVVKAEDLCSIPKTHVEEDKTPTFGIPATTHASHPHKLIDAL